MQKKELCITAYPKSGVTWLIHLLCDMLDSPQQDLPEQSLIWHGPGRDGNFVIGKRHEWYQPEKHDNKTVIFLQRDPRDVVISAWFYRGRKTSLAESMRTMWTIEPNYKDWLGSWSKSNNVICTSFEAMSLYPTVVLKGIFFELSAGETFNRNAIKNVIERQSFSNMQKQIDTHFVRKGIVGDWKNHFTREIAKEFNNHLGEFMLDNDYIDSLDWWRDV